MSESTKPVYEMRAVRVNPPEPLWYDDPQELLAFLRWFFDGHVSVRIASEIFAVLEKPYKWNEEYAGYKLDRETK